MELNSPCPCGSDQFFSACCQPVIGGKIPASTAEQLMRSRYSAFVVKDSDYIRKSWHQTSRPKRLNFDDHPVVWLKLEIHKTTNGKRDDKEGTVDFSSFYLESDQHCELRERSKFVKENGCWYYLKGECEVKKKKITRNQLCPCGSTKKYKRCCLSNSKKKM